MTAEMKVQQSLQDDEYSFPYHYVAQFRGSFRHYFLDAWAINYASTIEYLLTKVGADRPARIVDIGCGDGRFSRELALAHPESTVVGIDYSKRAIGLASAMNPDVGNLQFLSLDITAPHAVEAFDLAVLMEVFEHLPLDQGQNFLQSVRGLLRKGGTLLLTVPHENKPLEYKHFQHFSVQKVVDYLSPCFDVVEVVPFEKRSFGRMLVATILSNRLFILNTGRLLRLIYGWYKRHPFHCDSERSCQRIFVKATAK
jgi:SAM-dependent methyltransferase